MTSVPSIADIVSPRERVVMVVGAYGSGKTEVAVNLAIRLAQAGRTVQIADLDIVNPYFRSREVRRQMEAHGIRVVVPPGSQAYADLPIVLPEIAGMLHPPEGVTTIFDVGGDDVGARVISSLRPGLGDAAHELWQVINTNRPFTATAAECRAMRESLEAASRLRVTGLVANTHLIEQTTAQTVLAGYQVACEVAAEGGLPLRCVALLGALAEDPALAEISAPLLRMERTMLPPWLRMERADKGGETVLPAERPSPIGVPRQNPPRGSEE